MKHCIPPEIHHMLQTAAELHHGPVRCRQAPPPILETGKREVVQVLHVDTEGVKKELRFTLHTHTNKNNSKRAETAALAGPTPLS